MALIEQQAAASISLKLRVGALYLLPNSNEVKIDPARYSCEGIGYNTAALSSGELPGDAVPILMTTIRYQILSQGNKSYCSWTFAS